MAWIKDLIVRIKGDSSGLQKETTKAEQTLGRFGKAVSAIGPMIAGAFSVAVITNFAKAAVAAYRESELASRKLLTALNGNTKAQKTLIAQAQQLQKTTVFEDDQIVKAQTMISLLVKDASVISQLTPLVLDLASAKEMDLVTAADLVAKTIGSETNALGRYGIQVEGAAGSTQRLTSLISELSKKVGGQSTQEILTGAGAAEQLKNAWSEFAELIGSRINPALTSLQRVATRALNAITESSGRGPIWREQAKVNEQLDETIERMRSMADATKMGPQEFVFSVQDLAEITAREAEEAKKAAEEIHQQAIAAERLANAINAVATQGERWARIQSQVDALQTLTGVMSQRNPEQPKTLAPSSMSIMGQEGIGLEDAVAEINALTDAQDAAYEKTMLLAGALQGIGNELAQGAETWQDFGESALNALRQVVSGLIAKGIASQIEKAMSTLPVGIGVGVGALVGGLAAGVFNTALNQIPSFAGGGEVTKPTLALIGDNPGRREMVIPSEQYGRMGGGRLTTEVSGRNLKIILDRENDFLNRT